MFNYYLTIYSKLLFIRGIGWHGNRGWLIPHIICVVAENEQSLTRKYIPTNSSSLKIRITLGQLFTIWIIWVNQVTITLNEKIKFELNTFFWIIYLQENLFNSWIEKHILLREFCEPVAYV